MAHYIDADSLRAELEKRLKNVHDYMNGAGMKYKGSKYFKAQGKESAYDALLSIIDSLQQEQPDLPSDLEEKSEKPNKFEDELKDYLRRYYNCDYPMQIEENTCSPTMPHIVEAARHFAQWGAEHARE